MGNSLRLISLLLLTIIFTTGCSATKNNEWLMGSVPTDTLSEPCIKCGEDWIFIQNEPFGAQYSLKRKGYVAGTAGTDTSWSNTVRY